jgi:indolepyruvate decarboxylase
VLVHRLGAVGQLERLLTAGSLRHATSLWGKSLIDESNPGYLGVYAGAVTEPAVRSAIEDASVLVVAGVLFTDLNSGFFTQHLPRARTVELAAKVASVGAATFAPVAMPAALDRLTTLVAGRPRATGPAEERPRPAATGRDPVSADGAPLTQARLWDAVADHLRPGDIVLADQGTAFYGMATHRLPPDVTFIGQPLWASIGYTLPALLGACAARPGRRGVLLIGDGAAQMTVQELSAVLRARLRVLVVVVDNAGYTVERAIHGPEAPYNDIAAWDWAQLLPALGPVASARAYRARTTAELADALAAADAAPDGVTLIQATVPRLDVPPLLAELARAASSANRLGS